MNVWMLTGLIANSAVTAVYWDDPELRWLGYGLAGCVLVQVLGIILALCGGRRIGAWMVLIGSAVLIPIGFIGALGARRVLDALTHEEFETRRAES